VLLPIAAFVGVIIPVSDPIGALAMLLTKVPFGGDVNITYGAELLHKFGIAVIVGIGGLTAVIATVFVIEQPDRVGVTTTLYTTVLVVPGDRTGDNIEFWKVLPVRNQVDGVHEYVYCPVAGGDEKAAAITALLPGQSVGEELGVTLYVQICCGTVNVVL